MKFLIFSFLLISVASATSPESPEIQEFEIEPSELCRYFIQNRFENDNFVPRGNDEGYTHGHLIKLTKSCDSGRDVSVILESRLFTDIFAFAVLVDRGDKVIAFNRFEEENRIILEKINWRDFRDTYLGWGLTVGSRSRNRMLGAGLQQKIFHNVFRNAEFEDLERKKTDGRYVFSTKGRFTFVEHEYQSQRGYNEEFVGANIAVGRGYSLDGSETICSEPCRNYVRIEIGAAVNSLEEDSHGYVFSEIDKKIPLLEAFSVFASIKSQKNNGLSGLSHIGAVGLKFNRENIQVHLALKSRSLSEEWDQLNEYDDDEEIVDIGFRIPLSL